MAATPLTYPKIPGSKGCPGTQCIAFEKYDGTNLHWTWDRDFGWHEFGTRRDSFQLTPDGVSEFCRAHTELRRASDIFRQTIADGIEAVLKSHGEYQKAQEVRIFTEFLGPRSFAGRHQADDDHYLKLFDVEIVGNGIVPPLRFVEDFQHLAIARVIYRGRLTGRFAEDVRQGRYGVNEGVVCKGGTGKSDLWMAKIKTNAYLERLKQAFADRWEEYWE
ncbi:MAG: hypothetical protein IT428_04120 [Planctomycetaceae bacterium]|nr:hypothetical protein [Planctomycetaceae bacterium]